MISSGVRVTVIRSLFTALLFVFLCASYVHAEEEVSREYLVKAAMLYNFAKFIDWPADAFENTHAPINACILGENPFGSALEPFQGETIKEREMVITLLPGIEKVKNCHIIFVCRSEQKQLPVILQRISTMHVLSVSDMDGFARAGGIINFVKKEKKIRFEINVDAAERTGLKVSSKLLNLAIIVNDQGEAGGK